MGGGVILKALVAEPGLARAAAPWASVSSLEAQNFDQFQRDDPADGAVAAERQASLARGIAQLSPAHREVVSCRYLLDLDEAETAAVLGWPRGTVKSRLHRALRHLQASLDAAAPTTEEADAP